MSMIDGVDRGRRPSVKLEDRYLEYGEREESRMRGLEQAITSKWRIFCHGHSLRTFSGTGVRYR